MVCRKKKQHSPTSSVPQILDSVTALASWDTQIHSAPNVGVRPMLPRSYSPGRNMGRRWMSGPCECNFLLSNYTNCCQTSRYWNRFVNFMYFDLSVGWTCMRCWLGLFRSLWSPSVSEPCTRRWWTRRWTLYLPRSLQVNNKCTNAHLRADDKLLLCGEQNMNPSAPIPYRWCTTMPTHVSVQSPLREEVKFEWIAGM